MTDPTNVSWSGAALDAYQRGFKYGHEGMGKCLNPFAESSDETGVEYSSAPKSRVLADAWDDGWEDGRKRRDWMLS